MKSNPGCFHMRRLGASNTDALHAGKEAGKLLSSSFIVLISLASISNICKWLIHRLDAI